MTTFEMRDLIEKSTAIRNGIKRAVNSALIQLGATTEESGLEYEWEYSDAPSIASTQFGDDLADCYVTKIWLDRGLVKVNLHAYYLGEDREGIDLNDECNVDWEDLLCYLVNELENREENEE